MGINVIGKTIMGSLFGKPATAMYPVIKNEFYPNTRGRILYSADDCNFCGLCEKRCPSQAIVVDRAAKMWQIDRTRCIACNFCISVCNKKSLSYSREYETPLTDKTERFWSFQGQTDPEPTDPEPTETA